MKCIFLSPLMSLAPHAAAERSRMSEGAFLQYVQPSIFVGHNLSWDFTAELACIIGKRSPDSGMIYGITPSVAYTAAGHKIALGIGCGTYVHGGGIFSVRLQYAELKGRHYVGDIIPGQKYRGLELFAGVGGGAGGLAASLGYFKNTQDHEDSFVSASPGFGF